MRIYAPRFDVEAVLGFRFNREALKNIPADSFEMLVRTHFVPLLQHLTGVRV